MEDPTYFYFNEKLMNDAAMLGDINEVQRLLLVSPIKDHFSSLNIAAEFGRLDILKALLPFSDTKTNNSWALKLAANNGHLNDKGCIHAISTLSHS